MSQRIARVAALGQRVRRGIPFEIGAGHVVQQQVALQFEQFAEPPPPPRGLVAIQVRPQLRPPILLARLQLAEIRHHPLPRTLAVRYDSTSAPYVGCFPFFLRSQRRKNMRALPHSRCSQNPTDFPHGKSVSLHDIACSRFPPLRHWTYVRFSPQTNRK